jgi:hypothetical protein
MNMQTGSVEESSLPSQNFAVVSLQRRVFSRSNIGAILINKESINYQPSTDLTKPTYSRYNRNMGLEYNLASSNNQWTGKALVLKSFTPGKSGEDMVYAGNLLYASKRWNIGTQYEYVGKNYNPEVGFVPRRGYMKFNSQIGYLFFPKGTRVLSHGPSFNSINFFNTSAQATDNENYMVYNLTFRNRSVLAGWVAHDYVQLLQPFDPTNSGKDTLARNTRHSWNAWGTEFVSKPQSVLTYAFSSRYGGYYANGTRLNLTGEVGYRFQPYVSLAVSSSYNQINLPEAWGRTNFWLVGPRLDVTMTNTLFFTAFMQYNEQIKNVNVNTRFQWRYKPASDLFIVYTDNYLPAPFSVKNRALVIKLTYWWNV